MSPLDVQDILERAKGSVRVGDHEAAEKLLTQYLAKVPESREGRLLLGTTYTKMGKFSEASEEFTNLLAKNPQDLEALNNIAVIYRRQGKLQDALGTLIDAIDIDPNRAEFHYNIGNIHKQLGNLKAASMAYARVVELNPDYVPAYNNLGTIYDQLREYDKAFNIFLKGLALDRNNPMLHFNFGITLEAMGRLEDAASEYKASLRSKPGWLEPMNNLGIVLFKQGHHKKASDIFNRILNTDPRNAEAWNNLGVVQADQGRTEEAIKNYRRAIESDPRYTKAIVNLERALENAGNLADAVVELEKLVKLSPDSAEVKIKLAQLYMKMERYPEALELAKGALDWEPENINALRIEGTAQRVMGNDNEARKIFEKILSIDPGNLSFHLDLADIYFKRKEYKEAEERILTYLARRPNDREAKLLLGKLYTEMGNRTHAIQVFEELAKADPDDAEALAAAGELHQSAGELEKALRIADKLVNLQGKRATVEDLSDLNKSLEFYENTVSAYSNSVREMWDRNIRMMMDAGQEENEKSEENLSLMLGSAGLAVNGMDEETETLFVEEEFGNDEMVEDDELSADEEPEPIDEDEAIDLSLDNMAEPYAPPPPMPSGGPWPQSPPPEEIPPPSRPEGSEPAAPPPVQQPPPPQAPNASQTPRRFPTPKPAPLPGPVDDTPVEEEEAFSGDPADFDESPEALPIDDQGEEDVFMDEEEESVAENPYEEEIPLVEEGPPEEVLPEENIIPEEESPPEQELVIEEEAPEETDKETADEDDILSGGMMEGDGEDEEPLFDENSEEIGETPDDTEEMMPEGDEDVNPDEIPYDMFDGAIDEESPEEEFPKEDIPAEIPEEEPFEEETPAEESGEEEIPAEEPAEEGLSEETGAEDDSDSAEEDAAAGETEAAEKPDSEIPASESVDPGAAAPPGTVLCSAEGINSAAVPDILGLMNYLKGLSKSLPEKERETFMQSDVRVSMEYLIDTMEGHRGLRKDIEDRFNISAEGAPGKGSLSGTLGYLKKLADALPDQDLGKAISRKLETVMSALGKKTHG
jgi:tetratricopeptide (TPR) repeat protein